MFGYMVYLSAVAIFLVILTNFGHMLVIWWNPVSWLYCGHIKLGVGENESLVRKLVICDIYMYMTTVSIAVWGTAQTLSGTITLARSGQF